MHFIEKHNIKNTSSKENFFYHALIEYKVDGIKYQIFSSVGTDSKGKVGIKKKIKYDPKKTNEAMIIMDWSYILLIFVLILVMSIGYCLINY